MGTEFFWTLNVGRTENSAEEGDEAADDPAYNKAICS